MSITPESVTAERVIHAPAERIFTVLADPAQHCLIDGSGSVRRNRPGNPERLSLGAKFSMDMRMGGPYRIVNEVVEFDEGRRIGWRHMAHNVWRYELEPVDGGTNVRETFDYTNGRGKTFLRLTRTPEKNRKAMEQTLQRLATMLEGGGGGDTPRA
jgi:uncharacterized protein YndB with AHSA1/START domain